MFCIFPVPISAPLQLNIDILLTYNSLYFQKNSVIRILSEKLKFFRLLWSSSINKISIKCCNLCNYNSKLDFFLILKHCAKITNYQCNNPANLGYFFLSQKKKTLTMTLVLLHSYYQYDAIQISGKSYLCYSFILYTLGIFPSSIIFYSSTGVFIDKGTVPKLRNHFL